MLTTAARTGRESDAVLGLTTEVRAAAVEVAEECDRARDIARSLR